MDIAALSISLNQAQLAQNVGIALTKKAMDTSEQNVTMLLETMTPHPTLGNSIDIKG
ncbi:YjfB family protein [Bacillus massiliigorillae]|uniref:YjfB family protein n=1 Tax=Bacillus massiliigorillae TaxID=1243664 RepID=UPI0003A5ED78|nr:YjfB family protein [Bacillus massiliigorillae]